MAAKVEVPYKVAFAEASLLDDALAPRSRAPLLARQVRTRPDGVAPSTILRTRHGQIVTLEAVTPDRMVLICDAANSRQGCGFWRQARERQGSDGADMENDLRWIANLGVRGEEYLSSAAVTAVVALCGAETASAAAWRRSDGVHCYLVENVGAQSLFRLS
jgi:hypothetical protein